MLKIKFLIVVFSISLVSCKQKVENIDADTVILSPSSLNIGNLDKTEIRLITFFINNNSSEVQNIVSNAQSCGCTKIKLQSKKILPHHKTKVTLTFNPEKEIGSFKKTAFFKLSTGKILIFTFFGQVT